MKHNIYALCDRQMLDRFDVSIDEFVLIAKRFGAEVMQYRDKKGTFEEKKANLQKLRFLWKKILIVNDEVALASFCDGVHIGQEDLESLVKRWDKSRADVIKGLKEKMKIVGLSTHNIEEIEEANGFDVDYIGLGAYRASTTKDVSNILSDRLPLLAQRSQKRVVAIGGVRVFDRIDHIWLKAIGSDLLIKALTYA